MNLESGGQDADAGGHFDRIGHGEMLRPAGPRYLRPVTVGGRLVYSTGKGSVCPQCGWPQPDCRCSRAAEEAVPAKPVARLRLEKVGRGGKSVTVVDGLPRNTAFVADLARALKSALGTGGTAKEGCVEIQGDHRERLRELLRQRGFLVKG